MKKALVKVKGVKKVSVEFDKKQATVVYDPAKTTPAKLAAAVRKETGFKASVKQS